ncbi:DEAD-box ATP-dependent RNA helicase 36 [Dendrobium catenatum]|uniref:DEAD-box ATP-dependent RNA helicase 36 n=1 Tax=Dendrobium catenatum TaxID=906689 RepID=A0A2I0VN58_9ASPA|nr:DEAD-box ATP-dependent RNA helicase 36 [Dendrobium catenatum]PKU64837.1 DEAD-box ATP-dependent RNA helicase 36 [Dendrobium catenatum]
MEEKPFRLFSSKSKPPVQTLPSTVHPTTSTTKTTHVDHGDPDPDASSTVSFADLGLSKWAVDTCLELGMRRPTPVQRCCIPRILAGDDVLGIAQTGSGKTAAFALPILQRLATEPYGVFALVLTPTRELACQLAEQFRALGSSLQLRCTLVVGGMDMIGQARALVQRPHIVVATPGRIKTLLCDDPDIPAAFSRTKFLVLDEADRVLDVGFEEELRVILKNLPKSRQTLLFSATMTSDLQTLLEISSNRSYFFEAYEGFKTVESLKQLYIFIPKNVKEVYLIHILSKMEDMGIRSVMIFLSTCRGCHFLSLLLEELDQPAVALHSHKSQVLRLSALNKFKSGQVPILLATDVASRGLDIPTVDLVINYDIPRYPRDYVHRVGRTARAGRGGLALSFITQNDVELIHEIENVVGKQMTAFECKEKEVLEDITKVYKARRVARMKMIDDGFEEKAEERKAQKMKALAEKGLLKKRKHKPKE